MRIGYDVRPFLKEETGVGIYFKHLLFALARIDKENEYFLFSSSFKDRFSQAKIPPFAQVEFHDFHFPVKLVNFCWQRMRRPRLDRFFRSSLDLTHSPTPLILPTRGKKIVTVYDLFFMDSPGLADREARLVFSRNLERSLSQADGIVTISRFTRDKLVYRFPGCADKVRVIHLGIDPTDWKQPLPEELDRTRRNLGLPDSFILFVGATEARKNLINLVRALKIVRGECPRLKLVIAGRMGEAHSRVLKEVKMLGLESRVLFPGYVSQEDLRNVYHLASLFVFPSHCEGFGLPLLEAMISRVPIVASEGTGFREIAGDSALYVRGEESGDIASGILRVLRQEGLRQQLTDRGLERVGRFSWEKTAEETLRFYRTIVTGT